MQFFDDCQAIIFLAPIGAFDQKLAEDRSVNRLVGVHTVSTQSIDIKFVV